MRDLHEPYIDADQNIFYFNAPTTNPDTLDYVDESSDVLNLGDGNVIVATGHSSTNRKGQTGWRGISEWMDTSRISSIYRTLVFTICLQ